MAIETHTLLALGLAVLVGAGAQSTTGIGLAIVLAPVCALLLDGSLVIGTTARLALVVDLALAVRHRSEVDGRTVQAYLLPAAAAVPPGLLLLHVLPPGLLTLLAGVASLVAAAVLLRLPHAAPTTTVPRHRPLRTAGFAAGLMGVTTGLSGPPVALDGVRQQLPAARRTGTLAVFFVGVDLLAVLSNPQAVPTSVAVVLIGAAMVGMAGGHHVATAVGEVRLRTGVLLLVAASALTAIIQALR